MSSYLNNIAAAIRKAPTGGEWFADSADNEDRLDALVAAAADSAAAGEMADACETIEQIRRLEMDHGDCPTYQAIIAAIQPLVVEWVADLEGEASSDMLECVASDSMAVEAEATARECGLRNLGQETWDMATELRVSALLDWAAGRDEDELARYGIRVVQDAEVTHLVCRDGSYHSSYHGSWGCGGHIDDADAPDAVLAK